VLDRRVVHVGVKILLERRRKPPRLILEDNSKIELKVLEWTVWTRFD